MALTDIISRIEADAQKQAQEILSQAEATAQALIRDCKKELQQKSQQNEQRRKEQLAQFTLQQTQILGFASEQAVLAAKREALGQLQTDLVAAVLADQALRAQVYAYAVARLPNTIERFSVAAADVAVLTGIVRDRKLTAAVAAQGDLGACLAYQGKAMIDCSIPLVIADIVHMYEGRLAQELFGG